MELFIREEDMPKSCKDCKYVNGKQISVSSEIYYCDLIHTGDEEFRDYSLKTNKYRNCPLKPLSESQEIKELAEDFKKVQLFLGTSLKVDGDFIAEKREQINVLEKALWLACDYLEDLSYDLYLLNKNKKLIMHSTKSFVNKFIEQAERGAEDE